MNLKYILIFLVLFGCTNKSDSYFDNVNTHNGGHLRGVEIGMTREQVKKIENSDFLRDEMDSYLHYDVPLDMGNSYTVSYDFSSENKLYEIELNSFFDLNEDAQKLLKEYQQFYRKNFGKEVESDDGFLIWKIKSNAKNIEFAIKDESEEYGVFVLKIRDLEY